MTALTNKTWIGGADEWATDADWSPTGTPASTDAATIGNGSTVTVGPTDFGAIAGTLTVSNGKVVINGGQLSLSGLAVTGGSLTVDNYGSLYTGNSGLGGNVYSQSGNVTLKNGAVFAVGNYLTGTVSGSVFIQTGAMYLWQDGQAGDTSGSIVDFIGSGGGTFANTQSWNGSIKDFNTSNQNALSFGGAITSFSYSTANKTLTVHVGSKTFTEKFINNTNVLSAANFHLDTANSSYTISYAGALYVPPNPTVTSATYDAATGTLVVTGTNFTTSAADFDPTALTLSGEDGLSYALTGGTIAANPTATRFTVNLTSADQLAVDGLLNVNGTSTTSPFSPGTTFAYGISTTSGFDTQNANATSQKPVTVSNALVPQITAVAYDRSTGVLTLTGTGFENEGTTYGLNLFFTFTGQGGSAYTLQTVDTPLVTSNTSATYTLTEPDLSSVNALLDANGTSSSGGTPYNLAAAAGWDAEVGAAFSTQSITVGGGAVAGPSVTSIDRSSATAPTNSTTASFTVTFSAAVAGVAAGNFSLNGSDAAAVANAVIATPTTNDGGTTWIVPVTGVTGNGTLGLDLSQIAGIVAVAGGAALSGTHTSDQTYTIDTILPAVAFDARPQTFDGHRDTVFTGTTSDGSGLASVKVYDGVGASAKLLGTATINGNTWSLSKALDTGTNSKLYAVAVDNAGNTATAAASFNLVTGLTGAYAARELDFVAGVLVGRTYFEADGDTYLAETISAESGGGTVRASNLGTYFSHRSFASYENHYDSGGDLTAETRRDINGNIYLTDTITHDANGGTTYDYTGGSAVTAKGCTSYQWHYDSAGHLTSQAYAGVSGKPYTSFESDFDAAGHLTSLTLAGYAGLPYTSYEIDYDSNGHVTAQIHFDGAAKYLAASIADDGHGGSSISYTEGTYFNGRSFSAYENDFDANGALTKRIVTNNNGSHAMRGYADGQTFNAIHNDTMTGGGSGETFVFDGNFGTDVVKDLATHLTGPGHDTVSIQSFANFDALVAATHDDRNHNAIITVSGGNTVRLFQVSKADVMAHSGAFDTHDTGSA